MMTPPGSACAERSGEPDQFKDGVCASLDSWFVLSQITQATDHSIVLRGSTAKYDIPIALKCHTVMSNDTRQLIAAEPLMYEILVYTHALTAVSDSNFFVPSFGTVRRRWQFTDPSAVSSEGLGIADSALLGWMLGFTYASVEDLNAGAVILMMRDHGPTSAWRYFSRASYAGEVAERSIAAFVVQMIGALEVMQRAGIVHGDLRWENVLYPRVAEQTYYDLGKKRYEKEWKNFFCVPVDRVVKIFDWDHALFVHMPSHAKRKARHSFQVTEDGNMKALYDVMGFFRLVHYHFPGTFLDDAEISSMEPVFTTYAYRDSRDGQEMLQSSACDSAWPKIESLEKKVRDATTAVFERAAACLLADRRTKSKRDFELAMEGGEMMRVARMLRQPRVSDLDESSIDVLREAARASSGLAEGEFYARALTVLTRELITR